LYLHVIKTNITFVERQK